MLILQYDGPWKSDQVKEVGHKRLHVIYIKFPEQVNLQKQRVDVREGRMNVGFLWEEAILSQTLR